MSKFSYYVSDPRMGGRKKTEEGLKCFLLMRTKKFITAIVLKHPRRIVTVLFLLLLFWLGMYFNMFAEWGLNSEFTELLGIDSTGVARVEIISEFRNYFDGQSFLKWNWILFPILRLLASFCFAFVFYSIFIFVSMIILKSEDSNKMKLEFSSLWTNPEFYWKLIRSYSHDLPFVACFSILAIICAPSIPIFSILIVFWTLKFLLQYVCRFNYGGESEFRILEDFDHSVIPSLKTLFQLSIWKHSEIWGFFYAYSFLKRFYKQKESVNVWDVFRAIFNRFFTFIMGFSYNYFKAIALITKSLLDAKRDPTLCRKRISLTMYYQIFKNNLTFNFTKYYAEMFYVVKGMRIYRENEKILFNPGLVPLQLSKSIQKYVLGGKVKHAGFGKGTGDSTLGITSHGQDGFASFPNFSRDKRSVSLYNAHFDSSLLTNIESNFNVQRIFSQTGFDDPILREIYYLIGAANKLCN